MTLSPLSHIDESLALPVAAIALKNIIEEINGLWKEVYDICKTNVKSLTLTSHTLHLDFLKYMTFVREECTQGIFSLENIHSELLIASANGKMDQANAEEIIGNSKKLAAAFKKLSDENKVIKKNVVDCSKSIEDQKKSFSRKVLSNKAFARLFPHVGTTIFSVTSCVAVTELLYGAVDSQLVIGISALYFSSAGLLIGLCDSFQSKKFDNLRLIIESLKYKISTLFDYVDNLGSKVTGMVSDLQAYSQKTETCLSRQDNFAGERIRVTSQSLIDNALTLKTNLEEIGASALESSKYIRKIIKLDNAANLVEH